MGEGGVGQLSDTVRTKVAETAPVCGSRPFYACFGGNGESGYVTSAERVIAPPAGHVLCTDERIHGMAKNGTVGRSVLRQDGDGERLHVWRRR